MASLLVDTYDFLQYDIEVSSLELRVLTICDKIGNIKTQQGGI